MIVIIVHRNHICSFNIALGLYKNPIEDEPWHLYTQSVKSVQEIGLIFSLSYLDGAGFFVVRPFGFQGDPLVWEIAPYRYGVKKERPHNYS